MNFRCPRGQRAGAGLIVAVMTSPAAEPEMLDPLLDAQGVADILGVPVATVRKWRSESTGPPGFRVGRHVRWRREGVRAWIAEQEATEARRVPR